VDATLLTILFVLFRKDSLQTRHLGMRRPSRVGSVGVVLRALVALLVLDGVWTAAVGERSVSTPLSGIATARPVVIVLTGFAAAIVAPVSEEIFFRGFLYRSLRSRMTKLPASAIAGAMFAVVHTQYRPTALVPVWFFGVAACLLYERTGSILPGMALHSFVDASGFELALTGMIVVVPSIAGLGLAGALLGPPANRAIRGVKLRWRSSRS
jgi:hypothetical protein